MPAKFYVVWKGHQPGVYSTWPECQLQIKGFAGAVFKSFSTRELAETAFMQHPKNWIGNHDIESSFSPFELKIIGDPIKESISVGVLSNGHAHTIQWRGVINETKEEIFHAGPFKNGTVVEGEFMAVVQALQYCVAHQLQMPVYTQSREVVKAVKEKKFAAMKTRPTQNEELTELIKKAEAWLQLNDYTNPVLKWEIAAWGTNPAMLR